MVIPVSNGKITDTPLDLLNGFEKNFDSADTNGKEYVEKFFSNVLSFFPMRTKLELVHIVKTTHEITAMDESLDKHLKYNTLCIELIDCLCKSILKKDYPIVNIDSEHNRNYLFLQILNLNEFEGSSNISDFEKVFKTWSTSECGDLFHKNEDGIEYYPYVLLFPESYIKAFYQPQKGIEHQIKGQGRIEAEQKFIKAFRKTLDTLV